MQANQTRLSRDPDFEGYYGKRASTPGRPRTSQAAYVPGSAGEVAEEVKSVVERVGRRVAKVKQEYEDEVSLPSPAAAASSAVETVKNALSPVTSALSPSAQLTARTPAPVTRSNLRKRSELPGPPSPSVVADVVEEQSTRFVAGLNDLWTLSGIDEHIANLRETCSSVVAVQLTFLLIEGLALEWHIIPWKYAFDIPASGVTPSYAVHLPDLFILLTGFYWSTTLLWAFTSIAVPATFAYFYNLTIRDVKRNNIRVAAARYTADPLTFNVVKALVTWLVYSQGVTFGLISPEVAERVNLAIWGGHTAVLIGSGIGGLAALYEAAQRRTV